MAVQSAINTFIKKSGGWVASQLEACTRCGMCAEACPFYQASGNPEYVPVWKVEPLRRAYEQRFTVMGKAKVALGIEKPLTDADMEQWAKSAFLACSVCGKCAGVCPMGIEISTLISTVRAGITAAGYTPAGLLQKADTQARTGSPNGADEQKFLEWFRWAESEACVPVPIDLKGADTLVVFTSLEYGGKRKNAADLARILHAAGEKWTVSLRARDAFNMGVIFGEPKLQKQLLMRIYDAAVDLGVKRLLVTECGHGFTALRDALPNLMGKELPFTITHIAEFLPMLIREGRIKVKAGMFDNGHTYTFHDSCKIQRSGGILEDPREALRVLAPNSFREMTPNREQAICCGGGGGLRSIPEATELRMSAFKLKLDQVRKAGADVVVSTCDNCQSQLKDGFKHYNSPVEVRGLIEMVAEAMITE